MKILLSYLIYGNGYLKQFDMHLQSLLQTTDISDYHFMFITNKGLVSKIQKLMKKHNISNKVIFNIQPNIVKKNNLREYLEKLLVLKFNVMDIDISNYDRVLLGDVDVLVLEDLQVPSMLGRAPFQCVVWCRVATTASCMRTCVHFDEFRWGT